MIAGAPGINGDGFANQVRGGFEIVHFHGKRAKKMQGFRLLGIDVKDFPALRQRLSQPSGPAQTFGGGELLADSRDGWRRRSRRGRALYVCGSRTSPVACARSDRR